MILNQDGYRGVLKGIFAEKVARNPALSIRAFARQLGVAPSFLSEVLRGRKNFSPEAALRISTSLGMAKDESDYFCLLVQLESTNDPKLRALTLEKLQVVRPESPVYDLDVDVFQSISEWYHVPIIELTMLRNFTFNAFNVAAHLGISEIQADLAISRLLRLGLIERTSAGPYRKTKGRTLARGKSTVTHAAIMHFQQQMFDKASKALVEQKRPRRFCATDVFPIEPSRMPEIEAAIERCSSEIAKISDESRNKSEVYSLCINFFSLTRKRAAGAH